MLICRLKCVCRQATHIHITAQRAVYPLCSYDAAPVVLHAAPKQCTKVTPLSWARCATLAHTHLSVVSLDCTATVPLTPIALAAAVYALTAVTAPALPHTLLGSFAAAVPPALVFANTVADTKLVALPPLVVTVKKTRVPARGMLPLRTSVADRRTSLQSEAAGGTTDSSSTSTRGVAVVRLAAGVDVAPGTAAAAGLTRASGPNVLGVWKAGVHIQELELLRAHTLPATQQ
jgi:hypothetical protein